MEANQLWKLHPSSRRLHRKLTAKESGILPVVLLTLILDYVGTAAETFFLDHAEWRKKHEPNGTRRLQREEWPISESITDLRNMYWRSWTHTTCTVCGLKRSMRQILKTVILAREPKGQCYIRSSEFCQTEFMLGAEQGNHILLNFVCRDCLQILQLCSKK